MAGKTSYSNDQVAVTRLAFREARLWRECSLMRSKIEVVDNFDFDTYGFKCFASQLGQLGEKSYNIIYVAAVMIFGISNHFKE